MGLHRGADGLAMARNAAARCEAGTRGREPGCGWWGSCTLDAGTPAPAARVRGKALAALETRRVIRGPL